jgi:hypothetical protein
VSFRFKEAFRNRSVKLDGLNAINSGNNNAFFEVRIGGALTGAVFGTPTNYIPSETAVESDKTATAITGGSVVYPIQAVPTAKDSQFTFLTLDLDLPALATITLVAYTLTGTTDVISGMQIREEW